MGDSRPQFGCQSFIILLVVRYIDQFKNDRFLAPLPTLSLGQVKKKVLVLPVAT